MEDAAPILIQCLQYITENGNLWFETGSYLTKTAFAGLAAASMLEHVVGFKIKAKFVLFEQINAEIKQWEAAYVELCNTTEDKTFYNSKQKRFLSYRDQVHKVTKELKEEVDAAKEESYRRCFWEAALAILVMTTKLSVLLGPCAVILFWPIFLYHQRVRRITKDKEGKVKEIRKQIQEDAKDYQEILKDKNNKLLSRFLESLKK